MQFLADENFRKDVVQFLEKQGHDIKLALRILTTKKFSIHSQIKGKTFLIEEYSFIEIV